MSETRRTCEEEHTPEQPTGYLDWFAWAAEKHRQGWRQRRCQSCGLFKVWELPTEVAA